MTYLHSKNIRIGLSIDPTSGIYNIDTYYNEALKYIKADQDGKIPYNVLDPKFIDVYFKLFIHPLDTLGVDFYWVDLENPQNIDELTLLKHYQFYDMQETIKEDLYSFLKIKPLLLIVILFCIPVKPKLVGIP